jgi:hypothetical protein
MSAKRKMYMVKDKLGIINKMKRSDSKASSFWEFVDPEGTVHGWMKEDRL